MTFQGDPHRVLGISPGASLNEIRSAYRRLAKQYHPDAAGERALTRFLAIQAAYERLVDGEGRLRPADSRAAPGGAAADGGNRPDGPWQADPARARASRDAWRARRAGQGAGARPRSRGDAPGRHGTGTRARPGTAHGDATDGQDARPADGQDARRAGGRAEGQAPRRGPRKATPGSTTYDEATDGVRDPEWDGGSWYGPSSRTYWTINPREYADPRKHGPEYQERARRAASWPPVDGAPEGPPASSQTAADAHGPEGWGAGSWTYHADASSADADASPAWRGGGGAAGSTGPTWASPSDDPPMGGWPSSTASPTGSPPSKSSATGVAPAVGVLPDLETLARQAAPRHLLALARPPALRWRLLLAVIGWPPLGLAVGSLLTTVTGCSGFAASCPAPVPALSMAIQPLIVAGLILVPPAAALAAFGSIAALAVAVPVAAVLSVGTTSGSRAGAAVLGAVVLVAYLVALVAGGFSLWRPPREP
jgi:curved DNA-binding protein CbpA